MVTRELRFQNLKDNEEYDGIWACASLLHVPQFDLSNSIVRLVCALKPGGVLYVSFKNGLGQRISEDGRFFNDMTPDGLRRLLQEIPEGRIEDIWTTVGESSFQSTADWVNALFCKNIGRELIGFIRYGRKKYGTLFVLRIRVSSWSG